MDVRGRPACDFQRSTWLICSRSCQKPRAAKLLGFCLEVAMLRAAYGPQRNVSTGVVPQSWDQGPLTLVSCLRLASHLRQSHPNIVRFRGLWADPTTAEQSKAHWQVFPLLHICTRLANPSFSSFLYLTDDARAPSSECPISRCTVQGGRQWYMVMDYFKGDLLLGLHFRQLSLKCVP